MRDDYRRPSTKRMHPVPPEFVQQFIEGGHRRVERIYGRRSDGKVRWMAVIGKRKLETARRDFLSKRCTFDEAVRAVTAGSDLGQG